MDLDERPASSQEIRSDPQEGVDALALPSTSARRQVSKADIPDNAYVRTFPLVTLPIPPVFSLAPARAVEELFDALVLK